MGGRLVLAVGELLWDELPSGPELGGAPANFTVMSHRLGNRALLLSRVGRDERGREALRKLAGLGLETATIEVDDELPTGSVGVTFTAGQPAYDIRRPVAWDALETTPAWAALAAAADALCFGTLAQRDARSRAAIRRLLAKTRPGCLRVFDVNLRERLPDAELLREGLERATLLKMNEQEVGPVLESAGLPAPAGGLGAEPLTEGARRLLEVFPLETVLITRGPQGSLLATREGVWLHPGVPAEVADTVGAGDAFTAAVVDGALRGEPPAAMSEAGNRWGAWMAGRRGGMPPLEAATVARIRAETARAVAHRRPVD